MTKLVQECTIYYIHFCTNCTFLPVRTGFRDFCVGTAAMISRESKTKTINIIINCTDYSQAIIKAMNNIIKVKSRNTITAITVFAMIVGN